MIKTNHSEKVWNLKQPNTTWRPWAHTPRTSSACLLKIASEEVPWAALLDSLRRSVVGIYMKIFFLFHFISITILISKTYFFHYFLILQNPYNSNNFLFIINCFLVNYWTQINVYSMTSSHLYDVYPFCHSSCIISFSHYTIGVQSLFSYIYYLSSV